MACPGLLVENYVIATHGFVVVEDHLPMSGMYATH